MDLMQCLEDKKRLNVLLNFPGAEERLTIMRADLMEEGSFDEALKGVQGVFHCACPVLPPNESGTDPELTMVDPSVKGTLNVLGACVRSSTVERVVMTSSCSAVRYDYNRSDHDEPLDETCWSNPDYCRDQQMWYALAKTLAEKEAWKFAKEHNLDLVVVNPSYVIGRFPTPVPSSTVLYILYLVQGRTEIYPNQIIGFVHIDDVVSAHILVYEKSEACGRYICSSLTAHWREILSAIRKKFPHLLLPSRCKEGNAELIPHTMTSNKITQLGLKGFKSLDQMLNDALDDFAEKGLLPLDHEIMANLVVDDSQSINENPH
ncbi:hypothetical protein AXG93_2931s1330 [Marchantia polymorpha subsp. ruderalis]|uniref:NAD-dependent epimerase/dehydratase domain-containing protein n=1 Tax=Marchantia polymorpha subsp. ruderalis TaxID=1480154 RepID=A0A176VVR4_MARPO|nr:hypothetical protein AXG93_2931s1330 [Marchantia polymorpha subsp. ruderalis]